MEMNLTDNQRNVYERMRKNGFNISSKKLVFQDEGEPIELKKEFKSEKGYS